MPKPGKAAAAPAPTASNTARVLAEYRERSLIYHEFCSAMRNLLVSLLDQQRMKYQISCRVKTLEGVREKIARNAAKGKFYRSLSDVEDLAGIRVVFYLESDKRKFLSALFAEMTRSRLQVEEHHKGNGYRATHVLAQFGKKRLSLSEYRRYAGLKCEIQLASALFQAWAEVEHDILYKRGRHLAPMSRATEARLKRALNEALANYVEPASDILESVARKARRGRVRTPAPPTRES